MSTETTFKDSFANITIPRFYEDKSVFLTGGTGFIGKVIVEKLLRGCPGLKNIYLLIRPKKGLTCLERIENLFKLPLFESLMASNPDLIKKVIPVPGDIVHQGLGISDVDRKLLCDNVEILIHSAATVRFDEPLRVAMEMNVIAVIEIVKLAREMKNLEVFLHVSTAYSQCNLSRDRVIEERFYEPEVPYQRMLDSLEWMSDDMLNSITKSLIGNYPNTYCFTKGLAEYMLSKTTADLPLIIVRPSIVCSALTDPLPGWIDNYNGISGFIAAVGKGVLRTCCGPEQQNKNDIVPVDFVSNCIITCAWYQGVVRPSKPVICNCTSGNVNPTTFRYLEQCVLPMLSEYPYNSIFRRPNFAFNTNVFIYKYWQLISHWIPAIIADGLSVVVGSKPRFLNLYKSIDNSVNTLKYFILNEWRWSNTKYSMILKAMNEEDKKDFSFDMRRIDWKQYYKNMTIGIKVYLIKDDMKELPKALQLQKRYQLVRWVSSTVMTLLACRFIFIKSEKFRRLWFEALFAIYRFLQYFRLTSVSV